MADGVISQFTPIVNSIDKATDLLPGGYTRPETTSDRAADVISANDTKAAIYHDRKTPLWQRLMAQGATGAVAGGFGLGSKAGLLAGGISGHPWRGAAIGAGAGALLGAGGGIANELFDRATAGRRLQESKDAIRHADPRLLAKLKSPELHNDAVAYNSTRQAPIRGLELGALLGGMAGGTVGAYTGTGAHERENHAATGALIGMAGLGASGMLLGALLKRYRRQKLVEALTKKTASTWLHTNEPRYQTQTGGNPRKASNRQLMRSNAGPPEQYAAGQLNRQLPEDALFAKHAADEESSSPSRFDSPLRNRITATYATDARDASNLKTFPGGFWNRPFTLNNGISAGSFLSPMAKNQVSPADVEAMQRLTDVDVQLQPGTEPRFQPGEPGEHGQMFLDPKSARVSALHETTHSGDVGAVARRTAGKFFEPEIPAMVSEMQESMRQGVTPDQMGNADDWQMAAIRKWGPKFTGQPGDFREARRWVDRDLRGDTPTGRGYRSWLKHQEDVPPSVAAKQHDAIKAQAGSDPQKLFDSAKHHHEAKAHSQLGLGHATRQSHRLHHTLAALGIGATGLLAFMAYKHWKAQHKKHAAESIGKEFWKDHNGKKVYLVDGEDVRNKIDVSFIGGGNHQAYDYVPAGELWIEKVFTGTDRDAFLVHETTEEKIMRKEDLSYDKAHDKANAAEEKFRQKNASEQLNPLRKWFGFGKVAAELPKLRSRSEVVIYGAKGVLCIKKDGYLLMPGGGIDDGETPELAVAREAIEEADRKILHLKAMGVSECVWPKGLDLVPGFDGSRTYHFMALDGGEIGTKHEDNEGFTWLDFGDAARFLQKCMDREDMAWDKDANEIRKQSITEGQDTVDQGHIHAVKLANRIDVNVPVQLDDHSCGPACVAGIQAFRGHRTAPQQKLASDLSTDFEVGTHPARISEALGLSGKEGWTDSQLKTALDAGHPVLMLCKDASADDHYVVAVGYDDTGVSVDDPAEATDRVITWAKLAESWHSSDVEKLDHYGWEVTPTLRAENIKTADALNLIDRPEYVLFNHEGKIMVGNDANKRIKLPNTGTGIAAPYEPSQRFLPPGGAVEPGVHGYNIGLNVGDAEDAPGFEGTWQDPHAVLRSLYGSMGKPQNAGYRELDRARARVILRAMKKHIAKVSPMTAPQAPTLAPAAKIAGP